LFSNFIIFFWDCSILILIICDFHFILFGENSVEDNSFNLTTPGLRLKTVIGLLSTIADPESWSNSPQIERVIFHIGFTVIGREQCRK
jgi:hypothetical protein